MTKRAERTWRSALWALLWGCLALCGSRGAKATPAYAQREARPCQYCHTSGAPGYIDPQTHSQEPTTLNARGDYYQTHDHTFNGYKDLNAAGAKARPMFHYVWKEELAGAPRRVAAGDLMGDGVVHLITLDEKPQQKTASVLVIRKWDRKSKAFVTEFSAETQSPPDRLEVGRYAGKDRPDVIVTGDGLWYWNGAKYAHKPASHELPLIGSTRLKDGAERVLAAETPTGLKAYLVNTRASGTDFLIDPVDPPGTRDALWGDMHGDHDFFDKMGVPPLLGAGGLYGLWEAGKTARLLVYYVRPDQDFDVVNDPDHKNQPKYTFKDMYSVVEFRDPTEVNGFVLWSTPRLPGMILDVILGDVKGEGKTGLLVLAASAVTGKSRSVYGFMPD